MNNFEGREMNSMQQEFDAVCTHLMTQRAKAENEDGKCLYRTADGLMCAVGCRIPDKYYNSRMEGWGLGYVIDNLNVCLPKEFTEYLPMFSDLQTVHDNYDTSSWPRQLKGIAEVFNLTLPEIVQKELV